MALAVGDVGSLSQTVTEQAVIATPTCGEAANTVKVFLFSFLFFYI